MRLKLLLFIISLVYTFVHSQIFNVKDFGARGDGKTKDTNAIKQAVEKCASNNGGTVLFPSGTYYTGAFNLTSNIILELVSDATILGSSSLDDYPVIEPLPSYNKTKDSNIAYNGERYCSLIHADGVTNVTIRGTGTVDGQGPLWWKRIHELNHTRPHLVEIMNGKDVTITGVTLRNSPMWTLHPIYCTNVLVDGIKIINPIPSPNTDGIDPDSSTNVMISNNYISTADDCISIKSGAGTSKEFNLPCRNITVTNNIFYGAGVAIGSEMAGSIFDVKVSNNIYQVTDNAVRIKSRPNFGGVINGVSYINETLRVVRTAIMIDMDYGHKNSPGATLDNLNISHLNGYAYSAGSLKCLPESPCTNIHLSEIRLATITGWTCHNVNGTSNHVYPKPCF